MADRKHEDFPIKFGPMWLRNLSREGSTGSTAANSGSGGNGGGGTTRTPAAATASAAPAPQTKYKLAHYRYGREEMLALYDKNSNPPPELKELETLYVPHAQRPLALTTDIHEEETREGAPGLGSGGAVGVAAGGGAVPSDRLGAIRGATGAMGRGRGRLHALSNPIPGRPVSAFNPTSTTEENSFGDMSGPGRSRTWMAMANYAGNHLGNRNGTENPDWLANSNRPYKRWPDNSNWRRSNSSSGGTQETEGGWRGGTDAATRPRPQHSSQEKWDRERVEQGGRERPSSWIPTRRAWSGDSTEDHLPEWAVDSNHEPGAGTFDSSGAFHGTSDDSSIPQRTSSEHFHGLSRSHTQGSITSRTRPSDDMPDSKVMPKKFDATEIKFKKNPAAESTESADVFTSSEGAMSQSWFSKLLKKDKHQPTKEGPAPSVVPDTAPKPISQETPQDKYLTSKFEANNPPQPREVSTKRFEAMRSEIKMEEANDERGNFNSVLITTNNSLRQKHQNIVMQPHSPAAVLQSPAKDVEPDSDPMKNIADPVSNMMKNLSLDEETSRGARSKVRWNAPLEHMTAPVATETHIPPPLIAKGPNEQQSVPPYYADTFSSMSISPEDMQNIWIAMQNSIGKRAMDDLDDVRRKMLIETFADTWYYEDPQQVLRGPFKGSEMCQWFLSGYFTSTLKVRRMFDTQMRPLGDFGTLPSFVLKNLTSTNVQKDQELHKKLQQEQLLHKQQQEQLIHKQQQDQLLHKQQQEQMLHKQQQEQLLQKQQQEQMIQKQQQEQLLQKQQQEHLLKTQQLQQFQQQMQLQQQLQQQLPPEMMEEYPMRGRPASGIEQNPVLGLQPNYAVDSLMNMPNSNIPSMPFNLPPNFGMKQPMLPPQPLDNLSSVKIRENKHLLRMPAQEFIREEKNLMFLVPEGFSGPNSAPYRPPLTGESRELKFQHEGFYNRPINTNVRAIVANNAPINSNTYVHHLSVQQNQNQAESLWGQQSPNYTWMQPPLVNPPETNMASVWDIEPPVLRDNQPLPDLNTMKTEDQLLQENAAFQILLQSIVRCPPPPIPKTAPINHPNAITNNIHTEMGEQLKVKTKEFESKVNETSNKMDDMLRFNTNQLGDAWKLDQLMQRHTAESASRLSHTTDTQETKDSNKREQIAPEVSFTSNQQVSPVKATVDQKPAKSSSGDSEKTSKNKENAAAKSKTKITKLKERNEEARDKKSSEDDGSSTKEKPDTSPPKSKKEDKLSKKELEKEKQELIKEGFTMVKGPERTKKETRKAEDTKTEEEVEKNRKHSEFMKRQDDFLKKLEQEMEEEKKLELKYQQQLELEMDKITKKMKITTSKKAPWSAIGGAVAQPAGAGDPPTLAEIQRLEREKKFEVIKEQQMMVQLIAQQQQASLAREEELQQTSGYNWTKYKSKKTFENIKSLTEIQEESRQTENRMRQAQPKPTEEPTQLNSAAQNTPWAHNGGSSQIGGFWEAMPGAAGKQLDKPQPSKASSTAPQAQPSTNKPVTKKSMKTAKEASKELPPSKEFETWCNSVLTPWSKKIDVPVFVGFLKDIESPFEVKDYVKCYLGETKDSTDFAKNFLEKRSKLLRVAQVTPVDDLCSPAPAKNPPPQTISSDFHEVKGKAKKVKKNKMLKIDARILGFSVTAAEDRINVGDIDSI